MPPPLAGCPFLSASCYHQGSCGYCQEGSYYILFHLVIYLFYSVSFSFLFSASRSCLMRSVYSSTKS